VAETAHAISARSWWWREFEPIVGLLSATIIVGAASGAVIGGLGGRLAMGPASHERPITPILGRPDRRSSYARSPFLKKRLVSTVFDEVEGRTSLAPLAIAG
jgi:hypothetical protein